MHHIAWETLADPESDREDEQKRKNLLQLKIVSKWITSCHVLKLAKIHPNIPYLRYMTYDTYETSTSTWLKKKQIACMLLQTGKFWPAFRGLAPLGLLHGVWNGAEFEKRQQTVNHHTASKLSCSSPSQDKNSKPTWQRMICNLILAKL